MEKRTVEDYLRAIYNIYELQDDKKKGIRSIDIARILKIKKPSVSAVIKKLTKKGYLKSKPYSAVFFTKKGISEARKITHNHRVIEYFLKDALKCDLKYIHDEAHCIEHAFSKDIIKKLDNFLGNPRVSPYGKRIHCK